MSQEKSSRGRGKGRGASTRPETAKEKVPKEEQKSAGRGRGGSRPKTAGGDKIQEDEKRENNRGGRGGRGRGGQDRDNDRTEGGRGGRGGRGRGGENRGGKPRQQNEDQWIYKFHHESFRKTFDYNITITADMDIPALPAKEDRLKQPEKPTLASKLDQLDAKTKEIQNKKSEKVKEKRLVMDGGMMAGGNSTFRDELNKLIKEQKEITKEKQGHSNQMRALKEQIDELDGRKRFLQKNMHPSYHSLEDIQDALAAMRHRITTCTLKGQEEAQIVKDIAKLERSVPMAEELVPILPQIKEMTVQKKAIWEKLNTVRDKINKKGEEIDKVRGEMDIVKESQNDTREQLDKISEQIDALSVQLNDVFSEKDKAKEEFWEAMFHHREQQDQMAWANWISDQVGDMKAGEEERQAKIKALQNEVTSIANPKKAEIDTCSFLIGICHTLKVRAGLVQDQDKIVREAQVAADKERMQERMDKMMQEGKIENGMSKQARENEATFTVGGKKKQKNKGKASKVQKTEDMYEDPFVHDITIVQKFSLVNISPPNVPSELDECSDKLKERQVELTKEGESAQKIQMEARHSEIKQQVEELSKQVVTERENRGTGRGSRGRGFVRGNDSRGGRAGRGNRGGRREERQEEDQNAHIHNDNKEFDFSDDEQDKYYKAPARATGQNQKQNQKKQGNLKFDEENFPDLM